MRAVIAVAVMGEHDPVKEKFPVEQLEWAEEFETWCSEEAPVYQAIEGGEFQLTAAEVETPAGGDDARAFGLGEKTTLDFPGESSGLLKDADELWGSERVTVAYGQGLSSTPIQMAAAVNVVANGGPNAVPDAASVNEGASVAEPTQKFGTFLGVYTPSVLTILGLIMYLRFGWVVGNVGLPLTLFIVLLATSITAITALT